MKERTKTPDEAKLIIKSLSPSLNKLLRMHWGERKKLKEDLAWEVFAELNKLNPDYEVVVIPQKVFIKITSYRKSFLDKDNFIGGLKPLIDAIKELKLIYDDSEEFLNLEAEQRIEKKKKSNRTEIIISPDRKVRNASKK